MSRQGQNPKRTVEAVLKYVDRTAENGCWQWTGKMMRDGYGRFGDMLAHRRMYLLMIGPIPHGLELDHLCRTPSCVNPAHLEPVTRMENVRRRVAAQTHCRVGHELTAARCQQCAAAAVRRQQIRNNARRAA